MKTGHLAAFPVLLGTIAVAHADSIDVVGYWRFEPGTGSVAVDSSPYGADGTMNVRATLVDDPAVAEVPLYEYPNDGSLALEWVNGTTGGLVTVEDPNNLFRMTFNSFAIEAWVRLDYLSNANGANQRQWICQKKADDAPGGELDFGFLVQAGDLGQTGRELLFQCGDGTNTFTEVSSLSIDDTGWHFVSLVYDVEARTLRFGLDGTYETIPFTKPYWPILGEGGSSEVYDAGPLLIGGHENTAGDKNQFVRGTIDEFRITRTALPVEFLLDGIPGDCDENGISDAFELETPGSDCNGNFVPDSCDLALLPDLDCNMDGRIDSCQADPLRYQLDDGGSEVIVRSDDSWTCWLNRFVVTEDIDTITDIELLVHELNNGLEFTVGVWSDPDGDGDPTDAQLLSSATRLMQLTDESWFQINIPDVALGPPGTSFFVGGIVQTSDGWPGSLDADAPHAIGQSWIIGAPDGFDPNDLTANATEFSTTEAFFTGNWVMRGIDTRNVLFFEDCNENGIEDLCDVSSGRSPDVDGDELPDECYLPGTYTVPGQFNDIATAARIVADGSTVLVGPGVWQGSVLIDSKRISVVSELGPSETTIVADPAFGPAVFFNDVEDVPSDLERPAIDGFTITGGTRGGVWVVNSDAVVTNNVITGNENTEGNVQTGGGVLVYNNSTAVVSDNLIENNLATYGGGIGVVLTLTGDVPTIARNTIRNNVVEETGGGIMVDNSAPLILDNMILDNSAPNQDGGGLAILNFASFGTPMQIQVERNVISGNDCSEDGGGIFGWDDASNEPTYYANNLIVGNSAKVGGGVALRNNALMVNNTIANNTASERAGALLRGGGSGVIEVVNSIIWANAAPIQPQIGGGGGGGAQVSILAYTDIAGGFAGEGNLDANPQFVNPTGDAETGDYRLAAGSPCIDAGTSELYLEGDLDLAGEDRLNGASVDMGCYELASLPCPGDFDGNGIVDGADLATLLGQWGEAGSADLNEDGLVDGADLAQLLGDWGDCG